MLPYLTYRCHIMETEAQDRACETSSGRPYYGFKKTVNRPYIVKTKVCTIEKGQIRMEEVVLRIIVTTKD